MSHSPLLFTINQTLNQPPSTVDVNISHKDPYSSTIIHKSHTHPDKPLTDSHALSCTLSHILFPSPSTHPHACIFPAHSFSFSASFPAFHLLSISLPLTFLMLSLSFVIAHIQTHSHSLPLSPGDPN